MAENFPSLGRDFDIHIHYAHRKPTQFKDILFKTHDNKAVKNKKQRVLKVAREKKRLFICLKYRMKKKNKCQ